MIKETLNVKKGEFTPLDSSCGKPWGFQITTAELQGKSNDHVMSLAALDEVSDSIRIYIS